MTTTLYRFYAGDDALLYVGIAGIVMDRWDDHHGCAWWLSAKCVTLEHFPDRQRARAAEKKAIRNERPRFNRADQAPEVAIVANPDKRYSRQAIVDEIRGWINSGYFPAGARLPSVPELSGIYRVSHSTANGVMRQLKRERLTVGAPGRATFVLGAQRRGHQDVVDDVTDKIRSGMVQPDDELPSIAQMADQYGTSKTTVKTARAILKDRGIIYARRGKGVYVAAPKTKEDRPH